MYLIFREMLQILLFRDKYDSFGTELAQTAVSRINPGNNMS